MSSLKLRFRYNYAFLPEYFSTVAISIPVSVLFLKTPMGRIRGGIKNEHLTYALLMYLFLATLLISLSIYYRIRYRRVTLDSDHTGEVQITVQGRTLEVKEIDFIEERQRKFFGRKTRSIQLHDPRGWPMHINEALADYEQCKEVLVKLSGRALVTHPDTEPEELSRIAKIWNERHEMFPTPRNVSEVVGRLIWRCFCLLPVGVCDVLLNVSIILLLSRFNRGELMVYSAPLSLMTSGMVARFMYYYMFTSTAMNKPMG